MTLPLPQELNNYILQILIKEQAKEKKILNSEFQNCVRISNNIIYPFNPAQHQPHFISPTSARMFKSIVAEWADWNQLSVQEAIKEVQYP